MVVIVTPQMCVWISDAILDTLTEQATTLMCNGAKDSDSLTFVSTLRTQRNHWACSKGRAGSVTATPRY